MLDPNTRSLYTAALTPPPGLVFDQGLATTYSLDPLTLLTIPVHLALGSSSAAKTTQDSGVMLLEGLRRVIGRLTVYTQQGKTQVPTSHQVLFGLLENMIIEVKAPRGGAFHPKLWLLRFQDLDREETPCLRLLILSRNLTMDRSWDLALLLEGRPGRRGHAVNRDLADFITSLPELAKHQVSPERRGQAAQLADEVRRTDWELPPNFESIRFHILGRKRRSWQPPRSRRLVVISPFCDDRALAELCEHTEVAEALISRPETLAELAPETKNRFQQCLIFQEAAETEDGEDRDGSVSRDTFGLHAKAYLFQIGRKTHLIMGSANATDAALLNGKNLEILVELVRKPSKVQGIDELLASDSLGGLLEPYLDPEESHPPDPAVQQAIDALEKAQSALLAADIRVLCRQGQDRESWHCYVKAQGLDRLDESIKIRAWPITVPPEYAKDIGALLTSGEAFLGIFSPQALTGLIAFELASPLPEVTLRFTLNLPIEGLPAEREAAIIRSVIRNQQGFLRYLLMLLQDLADEPFPLVPPISTTSVPPGAWRPGAFDSLPLLEELVRAFCRHPERLQEINRLLERLNPPHQQEEQIVPPEFLQMWKIFTAGLETSNAL